MNSTSVVDTPVVDTQVEVLGLTVDEGPEVKDDAFPRKFSKGYTLTENQVKIYTEFNVNALKSRGWSRGMIKKYLGKPDSREWGPGTNSRFMSLYNKMRVLEAEAKEEWKKDAERAKKHGESGKKGWANGGKPAYEKGKAWKELWQNVWDMSCFTPETVPKIYEEEREKENKKFKEYTEQNPEIVEKCPEVCKEYPEHDKAVLAEVSEMLCNFKEKIVGSFTRTDGFYMYNKIWSHLSWGGGFPHYSLEPPKPIKPMHEPVEEIPF